MRGVFFMDNYNLYNDIKARTDGEIYIGVVGPVRTGKSTFIKKFMDLMVIPAIENPNEKERIIDELPQSAAGRTVMTTEPKFIPKDSVEINLGNNIKARFRLIDCVGFLIKGAQGVFENEKERLVKTPWFHDEITFTKAAEYGTGKVIKDHSTIGIVVTTDGTIGELSREEYLEAEEKTINELKKINKPFVVLVNSAVPSSNEAAKAVSYIAEKYGVTALPVNCENLSKADINNILLNILYEFPVVSIEFYIPKWVELLENDNPVRQEILECARNIMDSITYIKDVKNSIAPSEKAASQAGFNPAELKYITKVKYDNFDFSEGVQKINIYIDEKFYYENLSELTGEEIDDEYELVSMIKTLSCLKREYSRYIDAVKESEAKGYGVIMPSREQINLSEPELIRNGNKFGVRIKAECPSVHMIRVNLGTEISPIVGSEAQANDLIKYISDNSAKGEVWDTSIFGKSIGELVEDGMKSKIQMLNDECQLKLQETMQKVVNETSGGLVCIII